MITRKNVTLGAAVMLRNRELETAENRGRITNNNYMSFAPFIDKNPELHKKEYNLFRKFLKEDFKKSYMELIPEYLPNAVKYFDRVRPRSNVSNELSTGISGLSAIDRKYSLAARLSKKRINFQELVSWAKRTIQVDLAQFGSTEKIYRYAFGLDPNRTRKCLHCNKPIQFYDFKYVGVYCNAGCRNDFHSSTRKFNGQPFRFEEYSKLVRDLSNTRNNIHNSSSRGENNHLDHKLSVAEGFKLGIHPSIVSSKVNLHVIPSHVNIGKSIESVISPADLIENYIKHHKTSVDSTEVVESLHNLAALEIGL